MTALAATIALLLGAAQQAEAEGAAVDGAWLYARHCESCHGQSGDGRGPLSLQMGRPARSFADGGFAFGNTRESIFRVVSSGMPGSVMPGFKGALTEEERWSIVDYVRGSLMPALPPEETSSSEMVVGPEARFARGHLPPIAEGLPPRPRGLLVGLPEGLTFEYRIDDVRLLGVRTGRFCDRTDWNGRGGTPLEPLGRLIFTAAGGDPGPTFTFRGPGGDRTPLLAKLTSTWVLGPAQLRYQLVDARGEAQVYVVETLRPEWLSVGSGFSRKFEIGAIRSRLPLEMFLCPAAPDSDWVSQGAGSFGPEWFVRRRSESEYEHILLSATADVHVVRNPDALRIGFELPDGTEAEMDVTYFTTSDWPPKDFDWSADCLELLRELGR